MWLVKPVRDGKWGCAKFLGRTADTGAFPLPAWGWGNGNCQSALENATPWQIIEKSHWIGLMFAIP
jgi:hypothetical protein